MKKIFLGLGIAILVIIVGLGIAAIAVDKNYHYEKSIVIKAPIEKVYENIRSSKAFNQWNPWLELDSNFTLEYLGTQGEIGDTYCWESQDENVGTGCHKIVELFPNQGVKTQMDFKKPFENTSYSSIKLEETTEGTKLTWDMDTELPYPLNLMKSSMDKSMDDSYGKGLEKLKNLCEQ
ncbi:SRPBCC family protein [Capnocytophaga sp. ARDL2]|uniref:SRPBCC family protein n=1 Tax=Capnocytophaga sp. ARDL2 TaxID=3238809 RepID=UPI0035579C46